MAVEVRADLGKPVGPWFAKLPPPLKAIGTPLHKLILSAVPGLKAEMKWGMPFYVKDGMICGIMKSKTGLSLFFPQGKRLADPKKLLQGSGKSMRSLRFTSPRDIPATTVKNFVKAAARLAVT